MRDMPRCTVLRRRYGAVQQCVYLVYWPNYRVYKCGTHQEHPGSSFTLMHKYNLGSSFTFTHKYNFLHISSLNTCFLWITAVTVVSSGGQCGNEQDKQVYQCPAKKRIPKPIESAKKRGDATSHLRAFKREKDKIWNNEVTTRGESWQLIILTRQVRACLGGKCFCGGGNGKGKARIWRTYFNLPSPASRSAQGRSPQVWQDGDPWKDPTKERGTRKESTWEELSKYCFVKDNSTDNNLSTF